MREKINRQLMLPPAPLRHKRWHELKEISDRLDEHPEAMDWVFKDLVAEGVDARIGRSGMSAEQTLRALVLHQTLQVGFEELDFELGANDVYRSFCRISPTQGWSRSTLHRNVSRVRAETLERLNQLLVADAEKEGIEDRSRVRTDATPVETNIHAPRDSAQLYDVCRVLTRHMNAARVLEPTIAVVDEVKEAKRLTWRISNARGDEEKVPHYTKAIEIAVATIAGAKSASKALRRIRDRAIRDLVQRTAEDLDHFTTLGDRVVDLTRRRVIDGEKVPASEKIVSIFEEHTDIIGQRMKTTYGHKIALTTGPSKLVLDCVVYRGNPNDKTLARPLMERQRELYGSGPAQAAFDGGFASAENLKLLKASGIDDVVFTKARGIATADMASSRSVYEELRDFRAGIEGDIAYLKNGFGLRRCLRHGWDGFRAHVWSGVLSANLFTLARRVREGERASA